MATLNKKKKLTYADGERIRKIIDPNLDENHVEGLKSRNEYLILPKIKSSSIVGRPINYDTERLESKLYRNLEDSIDYYDQHIKKERFISEYGGPLVGGKPQINSYYRNIIKTRIV